VLQSYHTTANFDPILRP